MKPSEGDPVDPTDETNPERDALARVIREAMDPSGKWDDYHHIADAVLAHITTRAPGPPLADCDIDVTHIRLDDGRCVISLNGQGHIPCGTHRTTSP